MEIMESLKALSLKWSREATDLIIRRPDKLVESETLRRCATSLDLLINQIESEDEAIARPAKSTINIMLWEREAVEAILKKTTPGPDLILAARVRALCARLRNTSVALSAGESQEGS